MDWRVPESRSAPPDLMDRGRGQTSRSSMTCPLTIWAYRGGCSTTVIHALTVPVHSGWLPGAVPSSSSSSSRSSPHQVLWETITGDLVAHEFGLLLPEELIRDA